MSELHERIILDVEEGYRKSGFKHIRKQFINWKNKRCCALTAAYLSKNSPSSLGEDTFEDIINVSGLVREFAKAEYNLKDSEIDSFLQGFDRMYGYESSDDDIMCKFGSRLANSLDIIQLGEMNVL